MNQFAILQDSVFEESQALYNLGTPCKPSNNISKNLQSTRIKNLDLGYRRFRKTVWTKEEDELLTNKVEERGASKWSQIAKYLPNRSGKQCRQRWHNHLRSGVTKCAWQANQYWILALCVRAFGKKWSIISEYIPGRSDNTIKNQWNCKMKPFKGYFDLKIDKLLDESERCESLSLVEQRLMEKIKEKEIKMESSQENQIIRAYCKLLEEGLQQYYDTKRNLLQKNEDIQQELEGESLDQLSVGISAGDCIFYDSEEQDPILPGLSRNLMKQY